MRAYQRQRLERLEAALFLAVTPCTCGGVRVRFETDPHQQPASLPSPQHPAAPVFVFRDPTRRPGGYSSNRKRIFYAD
jgi:hypothetical protein